MSNPISNPISPPSPLLVEQIDIGNSLQNYTYLIHCPTTGQTAVIDPTDADMVMARASHKGWHITHILNTHHHHDHVDGNSAVKQATGCTIIAPKADAHRIPGMDHGVGEGDVVAFGTLQADVVEVPGHTSGHIAYWFAQPKALFSGDTLFSMGCGRLFEGTPEQMWQSLNKLMRYPDDATVYCAHEYAQPNGAFAITVDPENNDLKDRIAEVERLRSANRPTVPMSLGLERRTNPFLRTDRPEIAAHIGMSGSDPLAVFTELRKRRDHF